MNKIYKLVWNKARNMYVAVSEITKSHRKETTRQKERLALAVAVSLSAFFGGGGYF